MSIFNKIRAAARRINPWQEWDDFANQWLNIKIELKLTDLFFEPSRNLAQVARSELGTPTIQVTLEKLKQLNEKRHLFRYDNAGLAENAFLDERKILKPALSLYNNIERLIATRNSYIAGIFGVLAMIPLIVGGLLVSTASPISLVAPCFLLAVTIVQMQRVRAQRADIRTCEKEIVKDLNAIDHIDTSMTALRITSAMENTKAWHEGIERNIEPVFTALCEVEKRATNKDGLEAMSIELCPQDLTFSQRQMLRIYRHDPTEEEIQRSSPAPITTQFAQSMEQAQEARSEPVEPASITPRATNSTILRI